MTGSVLRAEQRWESEEAWAEQMVAGELKRLRWIEEDLAQRRKGVRRETTMTWKWLAQRLNMGTAGSLANLLRNKKAKR